MWLASFIRYLEKRDYFSNLATVNSLSKTFSSFILDIFSIGNCPHIRYPMQCKAKLIPVFVSINGQFDKMRGTDDIHARGFASECKILFRE